ncbi:hypothetical protein [Agromyces sp. SYSU T00266]|uniref:hypothetical protein n=1 Tax=Agromyces zhanjiangensis TaxID=3158562 RepID=UPI0033967FF6
MTSGTAATRQSTDRPEPLALPAPRVPSPPRAERHVPLGRAGAIYDLVVTIGFATPWTAAAVLGSLHALHVALGLPGSPPPVLGPFELMLTAMMGTAVAMWALARIRYPFASLIAIDSVGRVAFSTWMVTALVSGASPVIVVFLVPEAIWAILQAIGVIRAVR